MLKGKYFSLLAIAVFCISAIYILYEYTNAHDKILNNFVREQPPFIIEAYQVKKLKYGDLYIAGITDSTVYLSSRQVKNFVLACQLKNLDTTPIFIRGGRNMNISNDARVVIDQDNLFLMQGALGNIRSGSKSQMVLNQNMSSPRFVDGISISDNSYIFRFFNRQHQITLGIFNGEKQKLEEKQVLRKQLDGVFCTDGILEKSFDSNRLFYVYYYRNQFISMDSNLKVLYMGKTIDTNFRAKIKVSEIKSNGEVTLSAPPIYVNKNVSANNKFIFIQSALKADNETDQIANNTTPIDVYRSSDGKYIYSFYIPDLAGDKMIDFKVNEDIFVALYHGYVYTFKLTKASKSKT